MTDPETTAIEAVPSIALCGFMGTGKTRVGRLLAKRLDRPFVDVDAELEKRFGKTIAAIFADDGEPAFRAAEAELCRELATTPGQVVALGGGAVLDATTRDAWQHGATLICLHAPRNILGARLGDSSDDRPLLGNLDGDRDRRLEELLAARQHAYGAVLYQVAADGPVDQVVEDVLRVAAASERGWLRCDDHGHRRVVASPTGPYPIWLGSECLSAIAPLLASLGFAPGPVALIVDETLRAYEDEVAGALFAAGHDIRSLHLPASEETKTLATVERIHDHCLAAKLTRERPVIAVGGGVIGDLAGFAAATFMRGVPFLQVPTTLLAMVDASIGGKTGVNRPEGKNLVGAFHHPRAVLIDTHVLATLPQEERRAGLGEVVKHALLAGGELLDDLEAGRFAFDAHDIDRAIAVKAHIVADDPYEHDIRATLNLGHTFAHAIEKVSDYRYRHGDAVAVGLLASAHLATTVGAPKTLPARVAQLLERHGLQQRVDDLEIDPLLEAMALDKKRRDGDLRFVLLRDVGDPFVTGDVSDEAVRAAWAAVTTK